MRFAISVLGTALLLTGCANAYDQSLEPAANQARLVGYGQCNSAISVHETNLDLFTCYLAAEHQYAKAINLADMRPYDLFAAQLRTIARDSDARRITASDRDARVAVARIDYSASLHQAYGQTAAGNAEATNILAGIAGGAAVGFAGYEQGRVAGAQSSAYAARQPQIPSASNPNNSTPQLAPNGTYVAGTPQLAPDGTYVGGTPQLAPNGTYVGSTP